VSSSFNHPPSDETAKRLGRIDGFHREAPRAFASKLPAFPALCGQYTVVRGPNFADFAGEFGRNCGCLLESGDAFDFKPDGVDELTRGKALASSMLGFERLKRA
jgi:hypothetical protein